MDAPLLATFPRCECRHTQGAVSAEMEQLLLKGRALDPLAPRVWRAGEGLGLESCSATHCRWALGQAPCPLSLSPFSSVYTQRPGLGVAVILK